MTPKIAILPIGEQNQADQTIFPSLLPQAKDHKLVETRVSELSQRARVAGSADRKRKQTSTVQQLPSKKRKNFHNLTMKKKYIADIRAGIKTVEGRIFAKSIVNFQVGDRLRFWYYANTADDVHCQITSIQRFASFGEMLASTGFKNCIPESATFDDAVAVYHGIPKYRDKARIFGVAAIHLKVINGR